MLLEHELRVRLRERRNRLYKTDYQTYQNELELMLKWLDAQAYMRGLLDEIESAEIDVDEWRSEGGLGHAAINFPDTEANRAKVCLHLARNVDRAVLHAVSNATSYNDQFRDFTEAVIDPLVAYLEDRIEEGSAVLSIILRYQRWVEWFRRQRTLRTV